MNHKTVQLFWNNNWLTLKQNVTYLRPFFQQTGLVTKQYKIMVAITILIITKLDS